jgi:hypothetical protein
MNGYIWQPKSGAYLCLFCGQRFEEGIIYPTGKQLVVAERAVRQHTGDSHGDIFDALIRLGKRRTGISTVQKNVLAGLYKGLSDKEIAKALDGISWSTVRNHRFQLRKKKLEAKLFLAIMELLENRDKKNRDFVEFRGEITVHDERTVVTLEEASKILEKHFTQEEPLSLIRFPRKQKEKLVILNRIAELLEQNKHYTEKEVNQILSAVYHDYVTIRRYLVDYGFLDRKRDGSEYWRN